ncbi:hypothetical protein AAEO57_09360 [Flavobacterium sp. DGU38]|uniref:Uncharacterized protein n=1 Tax=Flavobacterium calami TaxID=3139144 RepID=A0ABU9INH4_9FLAO
MTESQIKYLKEAEKRNIFVDCKQNDSETDDLIVFLKQYRIISKKLNNNSFEITDGLLFAKLMELKSIPDFKKWYLDKDKSITNNFNNYGVNNGVQSLDSNFSNSPIKNKVITEPNIKPDKKSSVQKLLSNPWVLLISGIAIEEITLGKIYKLICELF